jgi:hypothetical protein
MMMVLVVFEIFGVMLKQDWVQLPLPSDWKNATLN